MCMALLLAVALVSADYPSVSEAVAACAAQGGGRVTVPQGLHLSNGPVVLRSNVELHLEAGATVLFSDNVNDYLPGVRVVWEGTECENVSPLVYAYGCTNVAITGKGTLKAKMGFWWTWGGPRKPDCNAVAQLLKNEWAPKNVPIEERQLWKQPNARFRPQFLHFNRCADVRLDGFAVRGTPFWTIHFFLCNGVAVNGLDIDAADDDGRMINNSDGIDIEASHHVRIGGCRFCQGDDVIVLKSGRDFDGRRINTPTDDVVVSNCVVRRGHNLAAVGSELSGGIRDIRISGCRILGKVGEILRIKTNPRRGGFVENVMVEGVDAGELTFDVLGITTRNYYGAAGEGALDRDYLTPIRNVTLRNIRCGKVMQRISLRGDYLLPVENVTLDNVRVEAAAKPDYVASVRNLRVDGVAVPPTASVVVLGADKSVGVSQAIWRPETREYVQVFSDGTVAGTVVRSSRDRRVWSEPIAEFWPEETLRDSRVEKARIRREADGWHLDVELNGEEKTYFTPEIFWPFRPPAYFGTAGR